MEFRQLTSFIYVATAGSFTRAAERYGISQPLLSRNIHLLEKELGVRLFCRNGRGVTLTSDGNRFFKATRVHVESLEQAKQEILANRQDPSGVLQLGWTGAISAPIGAEILTSFSRRFPHVELQTFGGSSDQIQELINENRIDLGVVNSERRETDAYHEYLMASPLMSVMIPNQNESTTVETIPFRDVAAHPLLLHSRQHALRRAVDRSAEANGIILDIAAQIDEITAVRRLVNSGAGSSILTLDLVDQKERQNFRIRRIVDPEIYLNFCIAYPKLQRNSLALELAETIRNVTREAIRSGKIDARL